ncbi:sulfite exporter TauE/SafE family protein [Eionea flava]
MDYSFAYFFILLVTGLIAGVVNTLAGGGSNLTLPALMLTGMPADVANATNRVGVFLQCAVGTKGYVHHGKVQADDIVWVLIPNIAGGVVGALAAAVLPATLLKPLLLSAMIGVAFVILVFPSVIAPPKGTPVHKMKARPSAWVALFFVGIYGGFVQAGVGFLLITALAGTLRYDLVRSNALKLICTLAFTSVALLIFIADGLVQWLPGLVLAVGMMVGAAAAVKVSLDISQQAMKWFLFVMTLVASAAAMFL